MMNIEVSTGMDLIVALAWIFIVIQWLDIARQLTSLKPDVIPADLNLGERDAVRKHIEILSGNSVIATRARGLLSGWSNGWLPSEVVELAELQSTRDMHHLRGGGLFVLLILSAAIPLCTQVELAWIGIGALGATLFAKGLVYLRIDGFIENKLLTRLPAHLPGTAMTAAELAAQLGSAINDAFKNNIPQPDKMAAAVNASVENFRKASLESLESLQKKLGDSQGAMIDKWTAHEKQTSGNLEGAKKALESLAASFSSGQSTGVEKLQAALSAHVQQLEKITTASNAQAQGSMNSHSEQLAKASQAIASQLEKIMALEKDIQKVLHLQQVVDGTMKSVATAEEFKQTLTVLRTHIEASDKLLKELAKPRTIRLVETETQPKAAAPAAPAQKR